MKTLIKRILFGQGRQIKKIKFGIASGIIMQIDLNNKVQRYLGLDEREIQPTFKRFAKNSSVFIDIGASDGYYGLVYYKLNTDGEQFLCDAKVAFTKDQQDNFKLNNFPLDKIHIVSKFVSDKTDDKHIALDELLKDTKGNYFIKIDVDGGELEVLKGVDFFLRNYDCKIIVETHSKLLENACILFLKQLGYTSTIIPNAWYRLFIPELRPIEHNRWFSAEKI